MMRRAHVFGIVLWFAAPAISAHGQFPVTSSQLPGVVSFGGISSATGQLATGNWKLMETAQTQPPPKQQEEFIPIDQLPPEEEIPAAPMVVAAYVFIWVAFLAYVFTLIRRVRKVEGDLRNLERGRRT